MAQPPEPPPGKVWILNREMSDEFGPGGPGGKWIVYDKADSWDRTAAFDRRVPEVRQEGEDGKGNYILSMNPMWYEPEDIFTKAGRTYYFAGGGMKTQSMQTYGYFEVRIRPSDFPMGSGVFMHSSAFSNGPCGANYKTELDIIENMGYTGPDAGYWNNKQHTNIHVKWTDANCNLLPSLSDPGEKPLNSPLGFNVVGAWWKDKDSVAFYLDGGHWRTIEFIEDFYLPMPVILTMETYTWGGDDENNATNPKPVEYMFQDTFRTREERSVDYDWVRTWQLADIDTTLYNINTDYVGFFHKPDTMHPDSIVDLIVLCSATGPRDVLVSLYDSLSVVLDSDTIPVDRGVRSLNAVLNAGMLLEEGARYYSLCDVRPTGGDTGSIIKSDSTILVIESPPALTLIRSDSFPAQVYPSAAGYTVKVIYEAAKNMEIVVELRDPSGAWIGGGQKTVPDGNGIAEVQVSLISTTKVGSGYFWKSHIRPVGTTWRESVFAIDFIPFQVVDKLVDELQIKEISDPIYKTDTGIHVWVDYSTTVDAELRLAFLDPLHNPVSGRDSLVPAGKGSMDFFLEFLEMPEPGEGYLLASGLYARETDSLTVGDSLLNITVSDVSDSLVFDEAPPSFPSDTASIEIHLSYYALQDSRLSAFLHSREGLLLGEGSSSVPVGGGSTELEIALNDPPAGDSNYFIATLVSEDQPSLILAADTLRNIRILPGYTGAVDPLPRDRMKIYPNPASGIVYVSLPGEALNPKILMFTDISGRILWQSRDPGRYANGNRLRLDASFLQSGFYFMTLMTGEGSFVTGLVIQ